MQKGAHCACQAVPMPRLSGIMVLGIGSVKGSQIMTEITAPKSSLTSGEFTDEIREQLKYTQGVTPEQATAADV